MHTVYKRIADRLAPVGSVFIGDPPDAVRVPYVFVWGPYPTKQASSLAGVRGDVDFEGHVTVVDHSPANSLVLAAQVEALLDGWTPVVAGWRVFPLVVEGSEPVQTARGSFDPAANRLPAWVVLHVRVRAVKTSE